MLAPQSFSITADVGALQPLYPGAAPQALPVTLSNPNPVRILVTSLTVSVPTSSPGCDARANLAIAAPSLSPSAPVEIPARGSVRLPAAGGTAPSIGLLDLPVNQDACKNAQFQLIFSGSAHG